MEKINTKMGKIYQLGDGWTKDETGQVFDPDGYKWYGKVVSSSDQIITDSNEPMATIADTGSGGQRVLKFFRCKMPPAKEMVPKEEIFRVMKPMIHDHLFKCGLTTDDNHEPILHMDEENREYLIVVACKPSGRKAFIYDGMKEGDGGVFNVDGQQVIAHKTDNISTLFAKKKK